jgi:hypothetical protein
MLRLRLMQRLGLLGPILRAHRRIEEWEQASGDEPDAVRLRAGAPLRTLGRPE